MSVKYIITNMVILNIYFVKYVLSTIILEYLTPQGWREIWSLPQFYIASSQLCIRSLSSLDSVPCLCGRSVLVLLSLNPDPDPAQFRWQGKVICPGAIFIVVCVQSSERCSIKRDSHQGLSYRRQEGRAKLEKYRSHSCWFKLTGSSHISW